MLLVPSFCLPRLNIIIKAYKWPRGGEAHSLATLCVHDVTTDFVFAGESYVRANFRLRLLLGP